jgi:hypothetical protein
MAEDRKIIHSGGGLSTAISEEHFFPASQYSEVPAHQDGIVTPDIDKGARARDKQQRAVLDDIESHIVSLPPGGEEPMDREEMVEEFIEAYPELEPHEFDDPYRDIRNAIEMDAELGAGAFSGETL